MSEIVANLLKHSGKDEYGNLVLLFEDKKIKIAFDEDGEPLLMCNDVGRACGYKNKNLAIGELKSRCKLSTHQYDWYKQTSWHFDVQGAVAFLSSSRLPGSKRFLEFMAQSLGVVLNEDGDFHKTRAQGLPEVDGVEFKRIPGASLYAVGSDGSIWSGKTSNWKKLKAGIDQYGYRCVPIDADVRQIGEFKFQHKIPVHRLVLLAFKGEPLPKQMACHNNGDKLDNRPDNLRWGTSKDNSEDAVRHGSLLRGEDSPNAVLDANEVIAIRELFKRNWTPREIAKMLWLPEGAVSAAAYRRTWKHIV